MKIKKTEKTPYIIAIVLSILVVGVFIYSLSPSEDMNIKATAEEGIIELSRANFIHNSGYEWTGKDELLYAAHLQNLREDKN
jgi:hypothetical protein